MSMLLDQERVKLLRDINKFIDDGARLHHALELTFKELGFNNDEVESIIDDVRKADFSSLTDKVQIQIDEWR